VKRKEENKEAAAAKKTKKTKSSKSTPPAIDQDKDTSMPDAPASTSTSSPPPSSASASASPHPDPTPYPSSTQNVKKSKPAAPAKPTEEFSAIYLRRIAAELADDLDKVREAPDFKANSVPMLVHALRQGESMYGVGERGRVVGAGGA